MEYSRILKEIYEEIQPYAQEGKPASYIPELLKVNPDRYGICLRTIEGKRQSHFHFCLCEHSFKGGSNW